MNFKALMCQLGLVLASTTAIASLGTGVVAQELTVVSFGGAYQDAQSKALFQPAAKALGIKIKEETYTRISRHPPKVKAGAVTGTSSQAALAARPGRAQKASLKN